MPEAILNLTPQQDAAIHEREVSIALSAGAGCGKTFVLTQRFLALIEPNAGEGRDRASHDPLGGIVAITFTDRAAREMRDRIRAACHERLSRCPADDVAHWLAIVRALDSARISTIHSFCASILRANAVDAGIDPQFGLLDRATGDAFVRKIVSETVFDLLSRQDADCIELVLHYGLERTNSLLRLLLPGRFQASFERFDGQTPESLAAEWLRRWRADFVPRMLSNLIESDAAKQLFELLRAHEPDHKAMQERRAALLEKAGQLLTSDDPLLVLAELQAAARVQGGGGKSAWDSEEIYEAVKNSMTKFRDDVGRLIKELGVDDEDVQTAARFSVIALHVLRQLYDRYEAEKRQAGVLDFDDLLLQTRNLLRDSEGVCNRARAGIAYLMVDEFQDTDPVQSDIVRLLCGERLVSGTLFLVGDAKQSIYRFRRADPAVFAALRGEIPAAGRLPLSTNFRSQPAILHFVNCLFAPEMGESYEALRPHVAEQRSPTPAIEFLFSRPPADETPARSAGSEMDADCALEDDDVATRAEPKQNAEERRTREADWIARRIAALLQDATPRIRCRDAESGEIELRPVQPGDVAILFRALTNVWLYEDALRRYGIPYYLVGGRAFYAQQEVFDLVNLCSFLHDRDDQVSLAGVLRSPFFSLSDDTLYAMVSQSGSLAWALRASPSSYLPEEQHRQWKHASRTLLELLEAKDRLPLAALLNLALERTGYDAVLLAEFLGERKVANLHKLVDLARQFDRAGLYTIADFVARIRDSVIEQTDEELAATHAESSDVVRLMTIHQSKGLEFPVVIVADIDAARHSSSESAYFHPEFGPLLSLPKVHGRSIANLGLKMHKLLEEPEDAAEITRLFYVATTRAADYLILSAGLGGDKVHSPWMKLVSARFDLDSGLPAGEPYLGRLSLGDVSPDEIPAILVHRRPPEVNAQEKSAESKRIKLADFRECIENAEPEPLPRTLQKIEPDVASRRHFSVSEIERAVALSEAGLPRSAMSNPQVWLALGSEERAEIPSKRNRPLVDATLLGSLVHEVMERIDFGNPANIDSLIAQVLRAAGELKNAELASAVASSVRAFMASPIVGEILEADPCYRELDFLLRWPIGQDTPQPAIVSGQIDCLMRRADGHWKLVDYKTGKSSLDDASAVLRKYEIQLVLYALAAREMIDALPDAVELVMLGDAPKAIAIKLNDDLVAGTIQRIDTAIRWLRGE